MITVGNGSFFYNGRKEWSITVENGNSLCNGKKEWPITVENGNSLYNGNEKVIKDTYLPLYRFLVITTVKVEELLPL